jgi:hypothetical protein
MTPTSNDLRCAQCGRIPGPTEPDEYGFRPSPWPAIKAHQLQHDTTAADTGTRYTGPTVTRITYGTLHTGTACGISLHISTARDEYGRGSSHAVRGTTPAGRSVTYARNLSPRAAIATARQLQAQGWTRVTAYTEGF